MKAIPLSLSAGLVLTLASPPPEAQALTVTMLEVGNDVVMSGRGSLNLTALNGPISDLGTTPFVYPSFSSFLLGSLGGIDAYNGTITFPTDFGPGTQGVIGDGSGEQFGPVQVFGFGQEIWVPSGYQSGAPLNASAIFLGETFASLGVNPGVYIWSWGSDSDADNLTLRIGQDISPVPGPFGVLGAGVALGWSRRLRRRCAQAPGRPKV